MKKNKQSISQQKPHKPKLTVAIILSLIVGSISGYEGALHLQTKQTRTDLPSHIQIRFSPGGQCLQFTQQTIAMAQKRIFVQAYAFTAPAIAEALIEAHQKGVIVKILVDRSQITAKGSQVEKVLSHGIPIAIDVVPGIAHNKIMIIDDTCVLTGSFNWSNAAEYRNAENLLLINDPNINKIYRENWEKRAANATPIVSTIKLTRDKNQL